MADKKQKRQFSQTWLGEHQPFKFIFVSLPSITDIQRRWALFQIILSLVFFFVACAVGILTIDTSTVNGEIMIIAFILFGIGFLGVLYTIGLGKHWFNPSVTVNNDEETKRAERADELHKDIHLLIKHIDELTQKMGGKNGK